MDIDSEEVLTCFIDADVLHRRKVCDEQDNAELRETVHLLREHTEKLVRRDAEIRAQRKSRDIHNQQDQD